MKIQFYLILLVNIIAILLNKKDSPKSLCNVCKALFLFVIAYIAIRSIPWISTVFLGPIEAPFLFFSQLLEHQRIFSVAIFYSISIIFLLFLDSERKTDILMMSVVSINIYLLIEKIYHREFISFMIYIITILVLSSKYEKKEKLIDILKKNILNVSFYTLGNFFIYFSKNESGNMYIVYMALVLLVVTLIRSMNGLAFHPYKEYLDEVPNKKYLFKIYLLFALFIFPQHLIMFRSIFSLLNSDLKNLFLITIVIAFMLSLLREYIRRESNFTIFINVKLFVMHIILLTFLTKEHSINNLVHGFVPLVILHLPTFTRKKGIPNVATGILNYSFVICVLGLVPSIIFAVKTYSLVFLLNHNIYLFFLFAMAASLATIKFLIFFVKNKEFLIQIKNPFYYVIFLFILYVYSFLIQIPDKM